MLCIDPYYVLGIHPNDSKAAILKAISKKMQDKSLDLKTLAECQKILFDPKQSSAARFLFSVEDLEFLKTS
jgi:hypothetical protein